MNEGEDFSGVDVLGTIWKGRLVIVLVSMAFVFAGVAYALLAKKWYQARVVMVSASERAGSSSLSQLSGLASLAGINIGANGNSQESIATLRSRSFAEDFIQTKGLLPILFSEKWDAHSGQWKAGSQKTAPDIRDAVKLFDEKIRSVTEDKKAGTVVLSITWTNADEAAAWANALVQQLNARMRSRAMMESERNVNYLQSEIARTNVAALQQSIGKVLESEMQRLLLAKGSEEYAFKVVDPAASPKTRIKPKRSVIVIGAFFLGVLASTAILIMLEVVKGRLKD